MEVSQSRKPRSGRSLTLSWEQCRATGDSRAVTRCIQLNRLQSYSISRYASTDTSQKGGLKWLDLDIVEQRYLLTAAADTTVEAFDILTAHAATGGQQQCILHPLFTIKRGHPAAHRYQVTSISWYPVDTGLFITGSADQEVKVWDTNVLEVACAFDTPDKVICLGMSSCATSHALIAVGTKQPIVQLADMVSGAFTHTLTGHRSGVWSICWSPSNEHHIFTGDATGEVRLWDVRRSGCQALLDINTTQRPQKKAVQEIERCTRRAGSHESASRDGSPAARSSGPRGARVPPAAGAEASDGKGVKRHRPSSTSHKLDVESSSISSRTLHAHALAHEGPVTGILATLDGLNIVTTGSDNRVRLWDSEYLHNQLVHYIGAYNRGAYPKRLSSTPDGRYFFYPRGDDIQVFNTMTGQQVALLDQGHYDTVTACVYSPLTDQLFSCGIDGALLVWEAWKDEPVTEIQPNQQPHHMDWWLAAAAGRRVEQHSGTCRAQPAALSAPAADVDAWSDDLDDVLL